MAKLKQYKKKRGRKPLKKIASGGSYPFYQGRMGGGGPYFILKDRDKEPELQVPPEMLKWYARENLKAGTEYLGSGTKLVLAGMALGQAMVTGAQKFHGYMDPKGAAKAAQTTQHQTQAGKDEATWEHYQDKARGVLGASNSSQPDYMYWKDKAGNTYAQKVGSKRGKRVKSEADHQAQLAADKQRSDTIYGATGWLMSNPRAVYEGAKYLAGYGN
jgi:hypothetical protein